MFSRVLIANRGEIAVRIMAACQEMGIRTVAVYSEADRGAVHVRRADEARAIGPAPATQSYLNIAAIIQAAKESGADAIHPGYGFLSENADFAAACADAEIVFIGPPPEAIRLMGSKIAAKRAVEAAGVPTVPGYLGAARDPRTLAREAQRIGYPVMIKASAGGGGKGMRVVRDPADFVEALEAARREALGAFGDDSVFLEKLLEAPRHVEFQILADRHGHVIHLGERECSIQRRHQKIVEESPCVALTPALRTEMGAAAVAAARAAGYVNAGTCEFLLDAGGRYYFLEMNTRLQVEHPVTESVTGLDLVRHQLRIAAGEPLGITQERIAPRGHAIEVRLYAEDPAHGYLPSTGTVVAFDAPRAPGVRVDAGVEAGDEVSMHYDPMLAKLIVSAEDRAGAVARLRWALDHFGVLGVTTNLPLLRAIATDEAFAAGDTNTDFLAARGLAEVAPPRDVPAAVLAGAAVYEALSAAITGPRRGPYNPWGHGSAVTSGGERRARYAASGRDHLVTLAPVPGAVHQYHASVDGAPYPDQGAAVRASLGPDGELTLLTANDDHADAIGQVESLRAARRAGTILIVHQGVSYTLEKPRAPDIEAAARGGDLAAGQERLAAPMAGTVIKVNVAEGDRVQAHQTLVVLGAMKMEHAIAAPHAGRVRLVAHRAGDVVPGGEVLVELEVTPDGQR
ncbi:MAG TPA: acetyl-CoA carboxylase biotin carboxylase subunit [Ktedonobacterales bacterium]